MSVEEFERVVRVNLTGAFISCQAAAKQMVEQNRTQPGRGGSIVTMSSVNGDMAIPTIAGYNASKGGVRYARRPESECGSAHEGE